MFDLITVIHNEINLDLALNKLQPSIEQFSTMDYNFYLHDNRTNNIGFGHACNYQSRIGSSPIIGFLNPDSRVTGPFMDLVVETLSEDIVVTGANFNKNPVEIHGWGLNDWVCGAAMFVTRSWFEELGGFDERYIWSHEETDFIRTTESRGRSCKSLYPEQLPILHEPIADTPEDIRYKQHYFAEAERLYWQKWR
jgi:hypothetical protein